MISQDAQSEIRARLQREQQRLQTEIAGLQDGISSQTYGEDEGSDTASTHPGDEGSELFEREKNLTVLNTLQVSLRDVEAALLRLDAGTFGSCGNCGKAIGDKRLEAMPSAIYCIDCQSELERTGHLPT